jgi:hypothetical protein
MKILKQEPVKSYRAKMIDKFLDKYFPVKPITIPTAIEIRNAVIRSNSGTADNSTGYPRRIR